MIIIRFSVLIKFNVTFTFGLHLWPARSPSSSGPMSPFLVASLALVTPPRFGDSGLAIHMIVVYTQLISAHSDEMERNEIGSHSPVAGSLESSRESLLRRVNVVCSLVVRPSITADSRLFSQAPAAAEKRAGAL